VLFEGLRLDKESFEVCFRQMEISLTPKEFGMLALFLTHQNKVFTREHLINTVWGIGYKLIVIVIFFSRFCLVRAS